ncbi:hypothetical protein AB1N83_012941 [Pleurotus pulmonarius]
MGCRASNDCLQNNIALLRAQHSTPRQQHDQPLGKFKPRNALRGSDGADCTRVYVPKACYCYCALWGLRLTSPAALVTQSKANSSLRQY